MTNKSLSVETAAQRFRILEALRKGPVSTSAAREELGIMHPAGRVSELKGRGYVIETLKANSPSADGVLHLQGLYVLRAEPDEVPA